MLKAVQAEQKCQVYILASDIYLEFPEFSFGHTIIFENTFVLWGFITVLWVSPLWF